MEERLQVGKATRSTPRIHPSLRALVIRIGRNQERGDMYVREIY